MIKNSKDFTNKPKGKLLDLIVATFSVIVIIFFGIIIYKNSEAVKTSDFLNTVIKLSQKENPQEYKLYLTKALKKAKNKKVKTLIYSKLGDANLFLKNYPEAIKAYKSSCNLYPTNPEVHANLGLALGEMGEREQAIKELNIAKKLDPKIPQIYNNLGTQFANQEKNSKAIASLKKAIEINPKFYRAYANLSAVYFKLKDYENTKKYINLAIKNGANNIPALKELLQQQTVELDKKLSKTSLE